MYFPIHQLIRFYEGGGMIHIDGMYQTKKDLSNLSEAFGIDALVRHVKNSCISSMHLTLKPL